MEQKHGHIIELKIMELLKRITIAKNKICKDMDMQDQILIDNPIATMNFNSLMQIFL